MSCKKEAVPEATETAENNHPDRKNVMAKDTSTGTSCPDWCEDYGTTHEEFCIGASRGVLLTLEEAEVDSDGVSTASFEAYPLIQHAESQAVVNTTVNGLRGLTLTSDEARQIAAALTTAADDADTATTAGGAA